MLGLCLWHGAAAPHPAERTPARPRSPLNPPGDFGPTPVAPARGEAGGMVCLALLRILIGQRMWFGYTGSLSIPRACMPEFLSSCRLSCFSPQPIHRIGRHLPARKDVLIDGEAVAETLNAFGLLGANDGDLRQRRYPDRYAGLPVLFPTDHRALRRVIGDSPQKTCFHTKGFEISGFGEHLGEPTTKSRDGLSTASMQANEGTLIHPESFS